MKSRVYGTLITLVLVALTALAPAAQGKEEWTREFDVEPGQKIKLEMDQGGSLEVVGTDRDEVRIVCIASLNDIDDWDIEVKETRYGLHLSAEIGRKFRSNNFEVQLEVPNEFDIEIHSGGGDISITDVTGTFTGRTAGGSIKLENVNGEAHLRTGGGIVMLQKCDLNGEVTTGGGGGLVKNVVGNVVAKSGGGVVSYENVRGRDGDIRGPRGMSTKGTTPRTILRSTAGGRIKLDDAPEGAIVRTGGGDIKVRNAERFVKAKTGGGDISIEIGDGSVSAGTGAGDVDVIVLDGLGDDDEGIKITTGHGEVTLVLPADASVEFDLDLSYTKKSSRDFDIRSDFDLDIEHTTRWETKHGSPRKHIYGTAKINGGKHLVEITNVNGDIRIERR